MNNSFQIGEVVTFIRPGSRFHGMECTIVGALRQRNGYDSLIRQNRNTHCYRVQHQGLDQTYLALPEWLHRREPPAKQREIDRVVSWNDCMWSPHKKGVK